VFVEPFAGGASVSLQLLNDGVVEAIVLGERDPLVASFWKVLFHDTDWLIEQIETVEVTVANWRYFRETLFRSNRDRALACIFMNRTSFSGILAKTAGPIGGYAQESEYKIDCRFNVATLTERIRQIAALRERVLLVNHGDWRDTINKVESWGHEDEEVFYYLDPPFYEKAARLYTYYFENCDHEALHDRLVRLQQPWLLSYDPAPSIQALYSHNGQGPKRVDLLYTASGTGALVEAQELIITNLARLPRATRIWRSSEEWRSSKNGSGTARGNGRG
jgi:DNA adenine methylase